MSVAPLIQYFQYLQGWPPDQSSNILPIQYLQGRKGGNTQYSIHTVLKREANQSFRRSLVFFFNECITCKHPAYGVPLHATLMQPRGRNHMPTRMGPHSEAAPAGACRNGTTQTKGSSEAEPNRVLDKSTVYYAVVHCE